MFPARGLGRFKMLSCRTRCQQEYQHEGEEMFHFLDSSGQISSLKGGATGFYPAGGLSSIQRKKISGIGKYFGREGKKIKKFSTGEKEQVGARHHYTIIQFGKTK
jgi:hypothetical protein